MSRLRKVTLVVLAALLTLTLCACNLGTAEPENPPIPWPTDLLPEGLPAAAETVSSVAQEENCVRITINMKQENLKRYYDQLKEVGFTTNFYLSGAPAYRDDIRIQSEYHGPKEVLLLVYTNQPPFDNSEGAFIEGDLVVFKIKTNPDTGYEWVYTFDVEDVVTLVSDEFVPDETAEEGWGTQIVTFRRAKEGYTYISFEQTKDGLVFGELRYKITVGYGDVLSVNEVAPSAK